METRTAMSPARIFAVEKAIEVIGMASEPTVKELETFADFIYDYITVELDDIETAPSQSVN